MHVNLLILLLSQRQSKYKTLTKVKLIRSSQYWQYQKEAPKKLSIYTAQLTELCLQRLHVASHSTF